MCALIKMLCKFSAKFNTKFFDIIIHLYIFWTTTNLGKLLITESQLATLQIILDFYFCEGWMRDMRFVACANCTNLGDD